MESSGCLYTDTLVEKLRNKKEIVGWMQEIEKNTTIYTTIINVFELYIGAYLAQNPEEKIRSIQKLLSRLIVLNLSEEIVIEAAQQYSQLRKEGDSLENEDILIGTIALIEGCPLKTNNKKHFSRIKNLRLC